MMKSYIEPSLEYFNIKLVADVLGPSKEPEIEVPGGGDIVVDPFAEAGF